MSNLEHNMNPDDPVISTIPIQLSTGLEQYLQLHQYPLLNRPLALPPSAQAAGKVITARWKPQADQIEVHVPFDMREEVWNKQQGKEYGDARYEEDGKKGPPKEERRLEELRLRSERIPHKGVYMVGILRGDRLLLQPISATYKLRPHLGYIDVLSQKARHKRTEDDSAPESDEDEEPHAKPKKSKSKSEAKEVHVSARKSAESNYSGMTDMRREMLRSLRTEEMEEWIPIRYCDEDASSKLLDDALIPKDGALECRSTMGAMLQDNLPLS